ncbi:MAG: YigZ family protein [Cyclobacteriaceae bacterium]
MPYQSIDSYLTLSMASEGSYKEKGSKFLAFAFPVNTTEDIEEHLSELRKKHHDARHHCYAYILGPEAEQYRANDDGEPKHSAGDPILGQLRSKNLTNTLIVVVRYFGGTKLGISGLINAYKCAAIDAIDNNRIVERVLTETVALKYSYEQTNKVMRWVKEYQVAILNQTFRAECELEVAVNKSVKHRALKALDSEQGIEIVG